MTAQKKAASTATAISPALKAKVAKLSVCTIVRGESEEAGNKRFRELALRGWELKQQESALEEERRKIEATLLADLGVACSIVIEGVCRVSTVERNTVTISDAASLAAALGGRFDDLVQTSVSYKPEQKLKDIAADADNPLGAIVREALTVKSSTSVTWRASA